MLERSNVARGHGAAMSQDIGKTALVATRYIRQTPPFFARSTTPPPFRNTTYARSRTLVVLNVLHWHLCPTLPSSVRVPCVDSTDLYVHDEQLTCHLQILPPGPLQRHSTGSLKLRSWVHESVGDGSPSGRSGRRRPSTAPLRLGPAPAQLSSQGCWSWSTRPSCHPLSSPRAWRHGWRSISEA